jgi:hypothetical protein
MLFDTVSVAVIVCVPAVFKVAGNVPVPLPRRGAATRFPQFSKPPSVV